MIILEHTLIILLLLIGLLNARPNLPRIVQWAAGFGVALALISPSVPIALPWDWLAAIAIPLLLWQTAWRLVNVKSVDRLADLLLWSGVTVGIALMLFLTAQLAVAGAVVFGLLAASMVWRATEDEASPSYLGQLGPLALAFLLAEIDPAAQGPNRYLLSLVGGAGLGALISYGSVYLVQKIQPGRVRDVLSLGQAYLAYVSAVTLGLSGVAAATLSVAVFLSYGIRLGLWPDGKVRPQPLNSPLIFVLAAAALAFFGWQTHVPLTPVLLLEIGLGLLIVLGAVLVGRVLGSLTFRSERSWIKVLARVSFLILPALLLWPREVLLEPGPLALAFAAAGLAVLGTHFGLTPVLNFYSWLDEAGWYLDQPDLSVEALPVRDMMTREIATVYPDTPLPEVARLLSEKMSGCVLVADTDSGLVGIITEADLFIKEERIPRTDQKYSVLFNLPVKPEELPETYADLLASRIASDVMTSQVLWVKDTHGVGQAVKLMVSNGFKCLPVLTAAPEDGGKLVGVISRTGLIGLLSEAGRSSKDQPTGSQEKDHLGDDYAKLRK